MVARIAMTGLRLAMQVAKQASKMASKGKGRGKIKGKGGLLSGSDSGYNDIQGTGNYSDLYSYTANNQSEKAEAHKDNLKEINRLTDNIQKELIQKIQKQIGKDDITFTGNLRQNIKPDFEGDFKAVSAETPYAWFVEFGLPPGKWVNFDALMIWVEGKLGITDEQEDMIRFTANSPMRMLLYNHCLGTELCSDFPDNQDDTGGEGSEVGPIPEPVPFCCTRTSTEIYVAVGIVVVSVALAIMRRKR